MDEPIIFEDAEGRQYIEVVWVIDKLHEIWNSFQCGPSNNSEDGNNILDLINKIEEYTAENF